MLPGIKSIGWVNCQYLPQRVDLMSVCKMVPSIMTDIHPVSFVGEPECSRTREKKNEGYMETASLQFHSTETMPDNIMLGFVVVDVNGAAYLIGSREHPVPTIEAEQRCGTPSGDAAGIRYKIKHVALRTLIRCRI